MTLLALAAAAPPWQIGLLQHCIDGLTYGLVIALIALGYTMVYGIIGLINFAHGDLFMLCSMLTWTMIGWLGLTEGSSSAAVVGGIAVLLLAASLFGAVLNWSVDRAIYKPLRRVPKLAPLVSAIGVSFVFMNIGQIWAGSAPVSLPQLVPSTPNLLARLPAWVFRVLPAHFDQLELRPKDLMALGVVLPTMLALTLLVKRTQLGRAMRATAQDPVAARLMGINVDRVIEITFLIGGGLAGVAGVINGLYINTIYFQMGYINGLYAFTAAVLGGIGNIPGAVVGGLIIGMTYELGNGYVSSSWVNALIFGTLIVILVFRPTGLLGERVKEKV